MMMKPSRHTRSNLSLAGASKAVRKKRSVLQAPRRAVRVFDEDANDVTPQPLHQPVSGSQTTISSLPFDENCADHTAATGSILGPLFRSVFGSSSQSTIESVNNETEDIFFQRILPIHFPDENKNKEAMKTKVTEDMLKQIMQIVLTETDSLSLLDIPTTRVSTGAEDAEAIKERNSWYAEVCRNQTDKYLDHSVQTFNGLTKTKDIQCSSCVMVDAATTVFNLDMLDDPEQDETLNPVDTPETKNTDPPDSGRSTGSNLSLVSSTTTVATFSSLKGLEAAVSCSDSQRDLQLIMLSEKFQLSLFVMERSLLRNNVQPLLMTCRQQPLIKDPDRLFEQEAEEQSEEDKEDEEDEEDEEEEEEEEEEEDEEASHSPALKCRWVFSSELSRECSVSCMAWNKKNPDLLAVGFGDFDLRNEKPGLVLCWSLKNPLWPERAFHCGSAVTSLDFSVNSPTQLAVGMHDGSIAIFNVQSPQINTPILSSNKCSNRHIGPVWKLKWNQQDLGLTGEATEESLFSVGEDGRFRKWSVSSGGLDCKDLLKLNWMAKMKKTGVKTTETAENLLLTLPALCFDFHPTDFNIYVMSTREGDIHKCSCSNNQQFLQTYKKHFNAVNCISWCPLNPDVFLSCSSDGTIQLWNQDCMNPVLGLSSTHGAVHDVKWSPKWASVFGALTEEQLEIWDLNSSNLVPVIVQPAAPGVKMTSLLFASHTDCIVVGDSCGHVTVYQLKNLGGKGV